MRHFFLGKDEAVLVNGDIMVKVIDIDGDGDEVTLAIDIPEWMEIEEIGEPLFKTWNSSARVELLSRSGILALRAEGICPVYSRPCSRK